jgi:hypothetical protein
MGRSLTLVIRNPLVHCGKACWKYGRFIELFKQVNAEHVLYGRPDAVWQEKIGAAYHIAFPDKFSRIVIVDRVLDTAEKEETIKRFCKGRRKVPMDFTEYAGYETVYIDQSNAARMFYNFYTTRENYERMAQIARHLLEFNPAIEAAWKSLQTRLPTFPYDSVHFRFGDHKHSTEVINQKSFELPQGQLPLLVMADRKDHEVLKRRENIIYTDTFLADIVIPGYVKQDVVKFLLEQRIPVNGLQFVGTQGSTVSHYIDYQRYIRRGQDDTPIFPSWHGTSIGPVSLSWAKFWPDNVM